MKTSKLLLKVSGIAILTTLIYGVPLLKEAIYDEKVNRAYYDQVPIRHENQPCGKADNTGVIKIAGKPAVLIYDASEPLLMKDEPKTDNPQVYDYARWAAYAQAERDRRAAKGEYTPAYAR